MAEGTVKWFDPSRGFGYITPDAGGVDVFVQHTAITGPLAEGFKVLASGARVTFSTRQGDRGPEAVRVAPWRPDRSKPPVRAPALER